MIDDPLTLTHPSLPFRFEQRMTKPSRPGKQPKPVWVVVGPVTGWEEALYRAGGHRYGAGWSFYADPDLDRIVAHGPQTFAEQRAAAAERAADRAERYDGYAANARARSAQALDHSRQMMDAIPFGQPILVGHHSEGRDRRHRDRAWNLLGKGVEEGEKAAYLAHRAATAEDNAQGDAAKPLGFMLRRREEAAAEVRRAKRELTTERARHTAYPDSYGPPSPETIAHWERIAAEYNERVDYWQGLIDAAGGERFGQHNVKVGDTINGGPRVIKVNTKTLIIESTDGGRPFRYTITWDKVRSHTPAAALPSE